jgi:hypothetical protein
MSASRRAVALRAFSAPWLEAHVADFDISSAVDATKKIFGMAQGAASHSQRLDYLRQQAGDVFFGQ